MGHHRVGNVVVGVRPGVDHLVVALAEGDLAGVVGPLEPLDPLLGLLEDRGLLERNLEILDADGHAAHGGEVEPEPLEAVQELHRLLEAGAAVALQHQLREVLLLHQVIAEAELRDHPAGQDVVEQHPADRGLDPAGLAIERLRGRDVPELNQGVIGQLAGLQRHLQLGDAAVELGVLPEPGLDLFQLAHGAGAPLRGPGAAW